MQFSVGDIVHSELVTEEGRILRIVTVGGTLAYVVAVLNKSSGHETEALWRPKELKEVRERMRAKMTAKAESHRKPLPSDPKRRPSRA